MIAQQSINEIRAFSKKNSNEDEELINSIYSHLEKWDSQHFKDTAGGFDFPGDIQYIAERDGDKIELFKDITQSKKVYVNGKELNPSKEMFNKLVNLFKRKFTEQDSKDRSDIFNKFS